MSQARLGDNRRIIAAVFGVWALILQSLLPVAGALAAPNDDGFWVALCNSAGIETINLSGDGNDDPGNADTNSACNACTVCACSAGSGCCAGSFSLFHRVEFYVSAEGMPEQARLSSARLIDPHHTRGPPV